MKNTQIQVFCTKSIKFVHPKDANVTHLVQNHTFTYAPAWIKDTDIFKALQKEQNIKVIESAKDLKETEMSGKILAQKMQEDFPTVADEEDVDTSGGQFDGMSAKQLYNACIERGIEVAEKQRKSYYVEKLSATE